MATRFARPACRTFGEIEESMKPKLLILAAFALIVGCGSQSFEHSETPTLGQLTGSYFGTPYKLYLCLAEGGSYTAGRGDCTGSEGIAEGTWQVVGGHVLFTPKTETKQIKGLLRSTDLVKDGGHWVLVPSDARRFFDKNGGSDDSCLRFTSPLIR